MRTIRALREELLAAGFEERPGKGSHTVFQKGPFQVSLPMNHPNRDGRGLCQRVCRIIRSAQ